MVNCNESHFFFVHIKTIRIFNAIQNVLVHHCFYTID